jgi:hypothetical protein
MLVNFGHAISPAFLRALPSNSVTHSAARS